MPSQLEHSSQHVQYLHRLKVYNESGMFDDTGCICDGAVVGGRLGLYVFSQEKVIFSNLRYSSLGAEEEAALAQCEQK